MSEKETQKNSGERTEGAKRPGARLSEAELRAAIDKVFDTYDKDKSNSLDKKEMMELMTKSFGRGNLSDQEVKEFMSKMDSDGSNTIEREELFRLYKQIYC